MVYDFLITLKKPDYSMADRISQLLYIFALLAFAYFYFYYPHKGIVYLIIDFLIIVLWAFTARKKAKKGEAFFKLGLLLAAAGWVIGPVVNIWMGVLYALAAILEKQVKYTPEIGFSPEEISFNTLPRKVIKWSEVSNVLIKDSLITIDQKNNKLFQKEIEGYVTPEIEKEFNEFAAANMTKST
jgi:energy-coupling factor transporter transmembrane protein EcfT